MMGSLGVAGPTPLVYLGPLSEAIDFLALPEIRKAVDIELSEASRSCALLLEKHRPVLEAVARFLAEHGRIDGDQVAQMLAGGI